MSEQNGQQPQDNNSPNYSEMSINQLKEIATQQGVTPEGNKSSKETWIQALQEANASPKVDNFAPKNFQEQTNDVGSLDARETIYEDVLQKLEQRGIDISNTSVTFDGNEALSYRDNNVKNQLTDSQADLLKSALNDPQNFKGSVEIKSGNRVLLKIENGSVTRDTIGLTQKTTTVAVESSTKELYEKYSEKAKGQGLEKTQQIAQNAISDGLNGEQAKKVIRQQDKAYQNSKAQQGEQAADRMLNQIVNQVIRQQQIQKQQEEKQQNQEQELAASR